MVRRKGEGMTPAAKAALEKAEAAFKKPNAIVEGLKRRGMFKKSLHKRQPGAEPDDEPPAPKRKVVPKSQVRKTKARARKPQIAAEKPRKDFKPGPAPDQPKARRDAERLQESIDKALSAPFFGDLCRSITPDLEGGVHEISYACRHCKDANFGPAKLALKGCSAEQSGAWVPEFVERVRAFRTEHARCWLHPGQTPKMKKKRFKPQKLFAD